MDITDTLAPNSEQLDAVDLVGSPRTFTIESVSKGNAEQPVNIHLAEFPRPWRPGKNMRRVLAGVWGKETAAWVGRRVTLFCDPRVKFGGEEVGGVRISHMSGIDKPTKVPVIVTRGKGGTYLVEPLTADAPTSPPVTDDTEARIEALKAEWATAKPERQAAIQAEVEALRAGEPSVAEQEPAQ